MNQEMKRMYFWNSTKFQYYNNREDKNSQRNEMLPDTKSAKQQRQIKITSTKFSSHKLGGIPTSPLIPSGNKKNANSLVVKVMNTKNMQATMLPNSKIEQIEHYLTK